MSNDIEKHEEINLHISKKLFWKFIVLIFGILWYWYSIGYWQEEIQFNIDYAWIPFIATMFLITVFNYLVNKLCGE